MFSFKRKALQKIKLGKVGPGNFLCLEGRLIIQVVTEKEDNEMEFWNGVESRLGDSCPQEQSQACATSLSHLIICLRNNRQTLSCFSVGTFSWTSVTNAKICLCCESCLELIDWFLYIIYHSPRQKISFLCNQHNK